MKELKHTPGPWWVKDATTTGSRFSENWREILSGNRAVVFPSSYESSRYGGETIYGVYISEADARLIAAAPELLKSLMEAERVIRHAVQESSGRVKAEIVGGWQYHADAYHAVIAKATGKTS